MGPVHILIINKLNVNGRHIDGRHGHHTDLHKIGRRYIIHMMHHVHV